MPCADGRPHRYRPVAKFKKTSPALKRCTGCGKTVETYLWLKIAAGLLALGGAVAWIIGYLGSQQ